MPGRKKRRRRRPSGSGSGSPSSGSKPASGASKPGPGPATKPKPGPATSSSERRARKEEARRAREAARKAARRRDVARRALVLAAITAGILLAATLIFRASSPRDIPEAALRAADAAGCADLATPVPDDQTGAGVHDPPYVYSQRPPTSVPHDPSPLPEEPKVFTEPFARTPQESTEATEARAAHNLEHAFVIVYYRAEGGDALPRDVVQRLESLTSSESLVLMAPYPDLAERTSLALAAWNKLWECPGTVSPDQAVTIARGFIEAFRGTSNAPEPPGGVL